MVGVLEGVKVGVGGIDVLVGLVGVVVTGPGVYEGVGVGNCDCILMLSDFELHPGSVLWNIVTLNSPGK